MLADASGHCFLLGYVGTHTHIYIYIYTLILYIWGCVGMAGKLQDGRQASSLATFFKK